jgi:prepilin-type N-terminal cleavage/methylation domain-containing protein
MTVTNQTGERGFTLIELLMVISILAVLGAVVVPNVGGLLGFGKQQAFNADAATIQTAVDAYYLTRNPNLYPTDAYAGLGPGAINFSYLVTGSALLKSVPASAAPAQGGTGSYLWGINSAGAVTTTFVTGVYP